MNFILFAVVIAVFASQSSSQSLNLTPVTNWTQCSSDCRCGVDQRFRVHAQCQVKKLDKTTEFNLPAEVISLSLANNGIRTIGDGALRKLANVTELSLANNSINIIGVHAFQGMMRLQILDLQFNDIQEWYGDPAKDLPSLKVLKIAGNNRWIPSQQVLTIPTLKEVHGVTWSRHCTKCALIKISENSTNFGDTEPEDSDDEASGDSGDNDGETMLCQVARESDYLHPNEVTYGVSARFVELGFSPKCACDTSLKCFEYEVILPFLRQLYNVPRKLFHSQYAFGALIFCLNLVVLVVIVTSRLLRNNISFIIVGSMSLSDLLIGIHSVAIAKYNFFNTADPIIPRRLMESNSKICMYMGMVFTTGQMTAVINSLLLTLERYLVIVHYQCRRKTMNKKNLLFCLGLMWIAAILFASLPLMGVKNLRYHKWFQCTMPFHNGNAIQETSDITLSVAAVFAFLYLVSLALYFMIFCYARKSSLQFGIKREARLAKKIAILVSSNFILFTLPTVLLLVYVYSFPEIFLNTVQSFTSMQTLLMVGSWIPVTLFNVNSLVNPFLYPFRHSRFKKELRLFHSRLSSSVSERFHPVVVTAHELSLRTSALRQQIRHHFHSSASRREEDNSISVELQHIVKKTGRRASV